MLHTCMEILGWGLKIFTVYYVVMAVFTVIKRKRIPAHESKTKFAVLLAARNEEAVIAGTVKSLLEQHYPNEFYDIFVMEL